MENESLNDMGHNLRIFLTISTIITRLSFVLGISSVLLYLLHGLISGPYSLGLLRGDMEVEGGDVDMEYADNMEVQHGGRSGQELHRVQKDH